MVVSIPDPYRTEVGVYSSLSAKLLRVTAHDSRPNLLREISLNLIPGGKELGVSLPETDSRANQKIEIVLGDVSNVCVTFDFER
jgi:hypothetical protein